VTSREADIARIHQEVSPDETLDQIVSLNPFKSRDVSAFQPFFGSGFDVVDLPYWTEAAMLSEAGVNAVVFGPGQIAQAHTPNEFVTGEQLLKAIPVYQRALSGEFV
jgi:acetylornithine deacetylase